MTSPVAYWHVDDIEAKLAEVTAAGATVIQDKTYQHAMANTRWPTRDDQHEHDKDDHEEGGERMKTMTCKQLGGPCDFQLHGNTADEIIKAQDNHLKELVANGDETHKPALQEMKGRWKHPVSGLRWYKKTKGDFAPLPEDRADHRATLPKDFVELPRPRRRGAASSPTRHTADRLQRDDIVGEAGGSLDCLIDDLGFG